MTMRKNVSYADGFTVLADKAATSTRGFKQFDWDKAARIIAERKPKTARAGLAEDWGCTSGRIWEDGKPVPEDDTYVYLSSNWATPILVLDDDEEIVCMKSGEDSGEYWPDSAKEIIAQKT